MEKGRTDPRNGVLDLLKGLPSTNGFQRFDSRGLFLKIFFGSPCAFRANFLRLPHIFNRAGDAPSTGQNRSRPSRLKRNPKTDGDLTYQKTSVVWCEMDEIMLSRTTAILFQSATSKLDRTRVAPTTKLPDLAEPLHAAFPGCSDAGLQAGQQKRPSACLQPLSNPRVFFARRQIHPHVRPRSLGVRSGTLGAFRDLMRCTFSRRLFVASRY